MFEEERELSMLAAEDRDRLSPESERKGLFKECMVCHKASF